MRYKNKKKKSMVKSFKIGLTIVLLGGLSLLVHNNYISDNLDKITSLLNINKTEEIEYIEYTNEEKEILTFENSIVESLVRSSTMNPYAFTIIENLESYPRYLLELAVNKEETIEFVSLYPNQGIDKVQEVTSIKEQHREGEIPLFIQWDEKWGYYNYGKDIMAINGCGPTSLAMVAAGLTGDTSINPQVVAEFSEEEGHLVPDVGSSWSLMTEGASEFGLKSEEMVFSESAIISTLEEGIPIIASMGPGEFTSSGHYIVLTGVTDDGQIIINDSDSKKRSSMTWDIDIFMKETKNMWKLEKI